MRTLPEYLAGDRCPGDRAAFLAYAQEAQEQFCPASFLELHFAAEIVRDTWRSSLIARIDENQYSATSMEALRRSHDRLNAEIRRNTAELRRLQTDRILAERANLELPVPVSTRDILRFEKRNSSRAAASERRVPEPPVPAPPAAKSPEPAAPQPSELSRPAPKSSPGISLADVEAMLQQQFDRMEREERAEYARSSGRPDSVPLNRAA